jgi:ketosteroid isomerase-like protein
LEKASLRDLAGRVREALESADLEAYRELLDPKATWGPPDDSASGCHSRDEVLSWYRRARAAGAQARVTEVVVGEDKLLVGLRVSRTEEAARSGGEVERWQVLTVRDGHVADIRGFDDRAVAAARAGVTARAD